MNRPSSGASSSARPADVPPFGSNLEVLVARSPDGFLFVDGDARVESTNEAFCRLIGAVQDELRGLPIEEVESRLRTRAAPDTPWPALEELEPWKPKTPGTPASDSLMQDGRDRQWLALCTPEEIILERRRLQMSESPDGACVFIFRDVTQEAQVSRTKSDFVSAAAHEIRTPLSTVLGFSELLHSGQLSREEISEFAGLIHRHATELTHLLDELLDLSRIEASGVRAFEYRREALGPFIEFLLAGYGNNAQRQRIHMANACPRDIEILADTEKLMQALRNILHNALKYSTPDSPVEMDLSLVEQAGKTLVRIGVSDRGIGIPESDLQRIFVPFSRGANTRDLPGTGLGLSLARDIIRNHGGEVSLDSTLGKGTTVTVLLPAAPPPGSAQPVRRDSTRQG